MAATYPQAKSVRFPFANPEEWKQIEDVLKSKITTVRQLEESIETIAFGKPKGRLNAMSRFWDTHPSSRYIPNPETLFYQKEHFLTKVVPFMQELALQLPALFKDGLKLLLPQQSDQVTLTQEQAACLLVSGFLGLFAATEPVPKTSFAFPHFDFTALQQGINPGALHCLLHYFIRIQESMPKGNIIIERKVMKEEPKWSSSDKKIKAVTVSAEGTIEDSPAEMHADFANMYIGGGALEGGNVQEEILFVIKPECLISMLFCAKMEDNEAIIIKGAERFSDYSGYGMSFAWKADHRDKTQWDDETNSLKREIIGIDAIMGGGQFSPNIFERDINKAYIGFSNKGNRAIATGNWGCGAFGGNLHLKAFQQILAASQADCEVYYYTFKKEPLAILINAFQRTMVKNGITVGQLYTEYMNNHQTARTNVLEHMIAKFS